MYYIHWRNSFAKRCIYVRARCLSGGRVSLKVYYEKMRGVVGRQEMNEGGWDGNLRWSDLTWRRSWLPRGHELSLTAGVSVLFPGPLAQVRQRGQVREGNRKRNRVMFFHTCRTDTRSYIHYHLSHFNIPPELPICLFIVHFSYCLTLVFYWHARWKGLLEHDVF